MGSSSHRNTHRSLCLFLAHLEQRVDHVTAANDVLLRRGAGNGGGGAASALPGRNAGYPVTPPPSAQGMQPPYTTHVRAAYWTAGQATGALLCAGRWRSLLACVPAIRCAHPIHCPTRVRLHISPGRQTCRRQHRWRPSGPSAWGRHAPRRSAVAGGRGDEKDMRARGGALLSRHDRIPSNDIIRMD